jgi:hypothetical protein
VLFQINVKEVIRELNRGSSGGIWVSTVPWTESLSDTISYTQGSILGGMQTMRNLHSKLRLLEPEPGPECQCTHHLRELPLMSQHPFGRAWAETEISWLLQLSHNVSRSLC